MLFVPNKKATFHAHFVPKNSRFHLRPVKATAPCIRQSRRNLKNAQLGLDECRVLIGILWQCYRLVSREIPGTSSRTPISILLPYHSHSRIPWYHSHSRILWSMGMVWVPLTWEGGPTCVRVPTKSLTISSGGFSWCLFRPVLPFCCDSTLELAPRTCRTWGHTAISERCVCLAWTPPQRWLHSWAMCLSSSTKVAPMEYLRNFHTQFIVSESCTTWDIFIQNPVNNGIFTISTG